MKRRLILFCIGVTLLSGSLLLARRPFTEFLRDPFFEEIEMEPYQTNQDVQQQVQLGWLPSLPPSTGKIKEKRQIDYGTSIIQFSFDQKDFPDSFPPMTPVDAEHARSVGPQWIVRHTNWIPQTIRDGRADKLLPEGFQLFRLDQTIEGITWYFLVHLQKGIAYGWSSNSG
jgi:hypothetical protein